MRQWSDGLKRERLEERRLEYRQNVIARATRDFQDREIQKLHLENDWLRATLKPKVMSAGA